MPLWRCKRLSVIKTTIIFQRFQNKYIENNHNIFVKNINKRLRTTALATAHNILDPGTQCVTYFARVNMQQCRTIRNYCIIYLFAKHSMYRRIANLWHSEKISRLYIGIEKLVTGGDATSSPSFDSHIFSIVLVLLRDL